MNTLSALLELLHADNCGKAVKAPKMEPAIPRWVLRRAESLQYYFWFIYHISNLFIYFKLRAARKWNSMTIWPNEVESSGDASSFLVSLETFRL
jgi:hypothetical protein